MNVGHGQLLVVNDAAGNLNETVTLLANRGYEVSQVTGPASGLEVFRRQLPDLVIIRSSVVTREFLQHLVQPKQPLTVLVLLEKGPLPDTTAIPARMLDFLVYPISDDLFIQAVERNLRYLKEIQRRRQTEEDLEKLNRALVRNLRALERDQQSGFQVQQSMMPESPHTVGNVTFSHRIIPSLILSGDFIDYAELGDHRLLFFMSDVSGHGASSAFVTVFLKSLSRRLQRESEEMDVSSDPALILKWFNTELLECELDHHVTMFMGIIDKRRKKLQYANAAQFPGAILSSQSETRFLEIGGLPLGLYENAEYDSHVIDLPENFTLILFSDGVFEIMSEQTLKAKEEQLLSLVKYGNRSIETLVDYLGLDKLNEVPDDIALLTVAKAV